MLVFSNRSEAFVLKVASILGAAVCIFPIYFYVVGKSSLSDSIIALTLFLTMTAISIFVRREKTIEILLTESFINVNYIFKSSSFKIPYKDIGELIFSDLSFSLTIVLKDGKKIPFGSTLRKESGDFTVDELDSAAVQGRPGDRLRLKKEIESRIRKAKADVK
jgi:hypothetical protein